MDMHMTSSIYLATLRSDIPNPFAKESDEEKVKEEEAEKVDNKKNDMVAAFVRPWHGEANRGNVVRATPPLRYADQLILIHLRRKCGTEILFPVPVAQHRTPPVRQPRFGRVRLS